MIERKTGDFAWYEDPDNRKIVWHTQVQVGNKTAVITAELPFAVIYGINAILIAQDAGHEIGRRKAGDMSDGDLIRRKAPSVIAAKTMPDEKPRERVSIDPFTGIGKP